MEKKGIIVNETALNRLIDKFKIAELNNGTALHAIRKKQYPTHSLESLQDEVRLFPTQKKYVVVDIHNVNHESFQLAQPLKGNDLVEFVSI